MLELSDQTVTAITGCCLIDAVAATNMIHILFTCTIEIRVAKGRQEIQLSLYGSMCSFYQSSQGSNKEFKASGNSQAPNP